MYIQLVMFVQELTEQLSDLQKKADGFESELMQERMSHMNKQDELETLRKQMDTVKEEMENEKQGVEARVEAVRSGLEAQLAVKTEVHVSDKAVSI